jgi:hypothetical protein
MKWLLFQRIFSYTITLWINQCTLIDTTGAI